MIEAVGHEFMENFFGSCESVLAENGLLVLQVGKSLIDIVIYLDLATLTMTKLNANISLVLYYF